MAQPLTESPWDASGYLTEAEAAEYIRTPKETLRKWRRLEIGPVPVRMPNGRIFYPQHLLDAWKGQLIEQSIADAKERQPGPGRRRRRRRAQPEHLGDGLQAIPVPVVAKALGYHDKTTTVVLAEAGGHGTATPLPAPRRAKQTHDRPLAPGRRP